MTQQAEENLEFAAPAAPQFTDPTVDDGPEEWDPTIAPAYVQVEEEESTELFDGEQLAEQDPDAEWTPDDALLDYTGTLAVWVNEDGILQRAQLVRYWRDRVRQQPLEAMFDDIFAQLRDAFPGEPERLPEPHEFDPKIELSSELLQRLDNESDELDERLQQLIDNDEGYSDWQGQSVSAKDARGRVTFTLSMFGQPERVEIEPRALEELTGAQLCRCVIDAHDRARAKYQEPEFVPGERFELAEKFLTISRMVEAAAANGLSYLPKFENLTHPDQPSDSSARQER